MKKEKVDIGNLPLIVAKPLENEFDNAGRKMDLLQIEAVLVGM